MKSSEHEHPYIAISGNVGVGKTTAGRFIADGLGYIFFPEPDYRKNPFFLQPGKAFLAETHFLKESMRIVRTADELRKRNGVVVDVPPQQHANVYPRVLLDERELNLFLNMFNALQEHSGIILPNLIVYLEAKTAVILERIRKRGRPFEQNITANDIEKHTELNHDWIAQSHLPVLFIPTDNLDYIHRRQAREHMVGMVREKLNSHV